MFCNHLQITTHHLCHTQQICFVTNSLDFETVLGYTSKAWWVNHKRVPKYLIELRL